MADRNYRANRNRNPIAESEVDPTAIDAVDDPLAELARLIGQADPVGDFTRGARQGEADPYRAEQSGQDWADDEGYAASEPHAYEPPAPPRFADFPPPRGFAPQQRDDEPEPSQGGRYAAPAEDFADGEDAPTQDERYQEFEQPAPRGRRPLPPLPSESERDQPDEEQWHESGDLAPNEVDEFDSEAPRSARRNGFVVTLAVLALVTVGVAGAFAYRTMFGGSMVPGLPPIIKASDGPNKIVPSHGDSQADATITGKATGSTGEKLVSREEQPLNMQAPPTTAPRVVSTIPVLPPAGGAAQGVPVPVAVAPPAVAPAVAPAPPQVALPSAATLNEPKKIHTVVIRTDQQPADAAVAAPPPPPATTRSVAPRVPVAAASRPAASGANAPLSIVPQGGGEPPAPARSHVARAEAPAAPMAVAPASEPAPAASAQGGYAVQVTSQRSEAEAQAAFRSLRAKFPSQLGGREPIIRRADLGDKGTYYRALVGPFASAEAAAGLCSNLKAAGGSCIVQRN